MSSTRVAETGQPAPPVVLPGDAGETVDLARFAGRTVVLYFYPKDDTSGCTTQAVEFSARREAFDALGAVVIGISRDSIDSHRKFKSKHDLAMPLLSDETGETCERYGVWVEKSMYGRKYMGIERSTFLVDPSGTIRQIWRKVKVPGHVDAVLAAIRQMNA
jgi:thioredoxin-dependent peroxiredoxin